MPGKRYSLSEDEIVDLIILSAYQGQIKRRFSDFRAVPLTKFVFSVADDLDLDEVTRCWYMLGNFTVHEHASERFFLHAANREVWDGMPTTNDIVELSQSRKAASLFARITESSKKFTHYFEGDTIELRRTIYQTKAPPQYRNLYLANLNFTVVCQDVLTRGDAPLDGRLEKKFSERVFGLQEALFRTDLLEDVRFIVSEYLTLMEAMIISKASKDKRSPEWNAKWSREFRALDEAYNNQVWKYPASQIADATLVGPRAEDFRRKVRAYLETAGKFLEEELPSTELRLSSKGLLPSISEIESSAGVNGLKAEDRDAIKEAFYLYIR